MKQGNYKAFLLFHFIRYFQGQGVDPAFLFTDTGIDHRTLKESDWLDFETQIVRVWKNMAEPYPDPDIYFHIAYDIHKNKSMGVLETIGKLASLKYVVKQFPALANRYSDVERFETHRLTDTSAVILTWPVPELQHYYSLRSQMFQEGLFRTAPKFFQVSGGTDARKIPDATVEVALSYIELPAVFTIDYRHLFPNVHLEYADDLFLVNGKPVARKILLDVDESDAHGGSRFFAGRKPLPIYCSREGKTLVNLPNQLGREGSAYRVLDDLLVDGKQILTKGQIFNAPYTRYNLSWQKISLVERVFFFLTERPKFLKSSREQLLEQLELADRRYRAEMEARKLAEEKEWEARRIKEDLEKSEARYRLLADNISDNLWTFDLRTMRYTYLSPAVHAIIGFTPEEAIHFALEDIMTPASYEVAALILAEEIDKAGREYDPARSRTFEIELYHKNGTTVWTEAAVRFIYDDERRPVGLLGVTRDISERKRLQNQLQKSQKMESIGLLAGGVAHDLNNVLSGIVSYPELMLLNLPENSSLRKPLEKVQESGLRAAAIVQDLLTMARGVATAREPLNINDVLAEYLRSPEFGALQQYHPEVAVTTDLEKTLLNIHASPVHIRKAVMNLVANAMESIDGKGTVRVATVNRCLDRPLTGHGEISRGEYAVLSVSDDGSGISSTDLERIFEPFYTRKKMGRSGTGLGLAVVWNVMQEHNGHIDMTTNENGTTFNLYFPVTREALLKENGRPPSIDYKGNRETILVVEDVESQREISCSMLDMLNYTTTAVASGEAAVDYLQDHRVDLVLLDMIMEPGISGHETYKRIIDMHPGQKAIIFSGFSETEEVAKTQALGAGRYLKKPVTLEQIGLAIKEELRK